MRGVPMTAERWDGMMGVSYSPEPNTGCWLWLGKLSRENGYGQMGVMGKTRYAHRLAWEVAHGPIPPGLTIDHLCRQRSCVNPDHLEVVTIRENVLRGVGRSAVNHRKTHCKYGHEFSPKNTHIDPKGKRVCRACKRDTYRKVQQRKAVRARTTSGGRDG